MKASARAKFYSRDPNRQGRGSGWYYHRGNQVYAKLKEQPAECKDESCSGCVKFEQAHGGTLGTNYVEVPREKKVEGVKAIVDSNGDLHKFDECKFVVGFECPECGQLYEETDNAAECCNDDD